jgi:hypothetical protein
MISFVKVWQRDLAILLPGLSFAIPATSGERKPTEFGVCFHHGAFGDEYTPAAASVLDDLRSAGKFWDPGRFSGSGERRSFRRRHEAQGHPGAGTPALVFHGYFRVVGLREETGAGDSRCARLGKSRTSRR